jgi:hypothetical protein
VETFHLDYVSCLLSIVSTLLVGRKLWFGLIVSIVNSLIVCAIGLHTLQFGFIPANLFCIGINAFSIRSWLKDRPVSPESSTNSEPGRNRPLMAWWLMIPRMLRVRNQALAN